MQRRDLGPEPSLYGDSGPEEVTSFRPSAAASSWPIGPAWGEPPAPGEQPIVRRPNPQANEDAGVMSVAQLDQRLKRLVEGATTDARVLGEVAEYRLHSSGHAYFKLKDETEDARIDCVMCSP